MKTIAPQYSDRLVVHARDWAQKAARNYVYRTGQFRKDEWAQNLIRDQGISEGLVGILCTLETCPSFALVPGPGRPQFVSRPRQQRVLYYYFLDPQFGLIHVRLQTWLPFTVQVYVNGHEWLAQQMVQKKLGFVQQHNAFTQLDDPARLNASPTASPGSIGQRSSIVGHDWSIRCSANCSPATRCIGSSTRPSTPPTCCSKVARPWPAYTARSWNTRCGRLPPRTSSAFSAASGIAASTARSTPTTKTTAGSAPDQAPHEEQLAEDVRQVRPDPPGGNGHQQPEGVLGLSHAARTATARHRWATIPMTKSVASLVHYQEQALACNRRYLDALAVVDDPAPAYPELRQLTEPKVVDGRSYAGFNPARREDVRLFRRSWTATTSPVAFAMATSGSRCSVTRKRARATACQCGGGPIAQTFACPPIGGEDPAHRRWRVTERGRHLLGMAVQLYHSSWPQLAA